MAYWNFLVLLALQIVLVSRSDAAPGQLTTSGENCTFPFTYKGVVYKSCTTKNHGRPWCSTTVNYDKDKKWGDCVGFAGSGEYTVKGESCAIPFTYRGKVYHSCNTLWHNRPWCSTTVNYDKDSKWGNCADFEPSDLFSTSGFCVFPFIHNGEKYKSCITNGNRSPWCSITANYNKDLMRGNCTGFFIGNFKTTRGQNCAFPYIYKGQHYNYCTKRNHDRYWCSTTTNYDNDKKWGDCEVNNKRSPFGSPLTWFAEP